MKTFTFGMTVGTRSAGTQYLAMSAWPEDYRPDENATLILNNLGYFGPGDWADILGGMIAAGCLDANL